MFCAYCNSIPNEAPFLILSVIRGLSTTAHSGRRRTDSSVLPLVLLTVVVALEGRVYDCHHITPFFNFCFCKYLNLYLFNFPYSDPYFSLKFATVSIKNIIYV